MEWENKPLSRQMPPAVNLESLAAVARVELMAADVPRGILRQFYEGGIGLKYIPSDGTDVFFRHVRREIVLLRERREAGRAAFIIKQFDESLLRLRDRQVACEVLHTDGGLTRMALTRDPAGNWIHLVETRAF